MSPEFEGILKKLPVFRPCNMQTQINLYNPSIKYKSVNCPLPSSKQNHFSSRYDPEIFPKELYRTKL